MPDIPGTAEVVIKGVSSRMVKNNTLKLYEVETAEGTKWTTFREPLARAAHALVGKPALIAYTISSNGQYQNYSLNEIGPAAPQSEFASQAADPFSPTVSEQVKDTKEITFQEFANVERDRQDAEARKQESIHRQVATKVAALTSKTPDEFWENVAGLVAFYRTGVINNVPSGVGHSDAFADTAPEEDMSIPF